MAQTPRKTAYSGRTQPMGVRKIQSFSSLQKSRKKRGSESQGMYCHGVTSWGIRPPAAGAVFLHWQDAPLLRCLSFLGIFLLCQPLFGQNPAQGSFLGGNFHGAHLPADRTVNRSLDAAREFLEAGRYADALQLVDRVLSAEADYFTPSGKSHKQIARQLLVECSEEAAEAYALLYEHELRSSMQQALHSREADRLAVLAARFPHENLGADCWLAWASLAEERGTYQLAADLYERLDSVENAAPRVETQLALQRLRIGHTQSVDSALFSHVSPEELLEQTKTARESWLSRTPPHAWLGASGGPLRNPRAGSDTSHGWTRWSVDLPAEYEVKRKGKEINSLTLANVIAVDDVVVAEMGHQLLGIDSKTGKRLWLTNKPASGSQQQTLANNRALLFAMELGVEVAPAEIGQTSLASDGQRVFCLTNPTVEPMQTVQHARFQPFGRRTGGRHREVNTLSAYSLSQQGKLLWEVSGQDPNGPLQGAFFLGAPTHYEGQLVCLVVVEERLELILVDAVTGTLGWRQPLLNLELGLHEQANMRLAGAGVAVDRGTAYCATGAGAVIAVDLLSRSLKWASWLNSEISDQDQMQHRGYRQAHAVRWLSGQGWRWPKVIATDDRVVVASPESAWVYCYGSDTGELIWSQESPAGQLLAGLLDDQALVIEKRGINCLSLDDGQSIKRYSLPYGEAPSGEGLLVGTSYWLPLSSGSIAIVDLDPQAETELVILPQVSSSVVGTRKRRRLFAPLR